jgi:hypothetical protein
LSRTRPIAPLPLELGEGQKHIQRQPAHACRGVELLRDRDEGDAAAVEDVNEPGEVGERPRQPIDLINHDHVDLACLDVGDQPFQGRPLHRAAGIAAVIVKRRGRRPALVLLREDVGGAGFALGVERIEGLVQTLLRRFPRVNCADPLARPPRSLGRFRHRLAPVFAASRRLSAAQRSAGRTNAPR